MDYNHVTCQCRKGGLDFSCDVCDLTTFVIEDSTLVSYCSRRNQVLLILSTIHFDEAIDSSTGEAHKPERVTFYNKTKVGVDIVDQPCQKNNVQRSTRRLPMLLFYNLLNLAAINSFCIYKHNRQVSGQDDGSTAERLPVSVYYETLCPDCIDFFRTQLKPTYDQLADYLDLDLIPFGNGIVRKHGDKWEFECQHGPEECEGNSYHGCAIDIAPIADALAFAECTLVQVDPTSGDTMKLCAEKSDISYESLETCRQQRGDKLLAKNAERSQKIGYLTVPAIVFNGSYDLDDSSAATVDLKETICSLLNNAPPQCK
nr:unnamed protein product [Callosobruchus analis]